METLAARGDLRGVGVAVNDWSVIRELVSFMQSRIIQKKIKTSIETSRRNKKK